MKALFQAALFVAAFFSAWFLLDRIDFIGTLDVAELSRANEQKLGDLMMETITLGHPALGGDSVNALPAEIVRRLLDANGLAGDSIRLTVIADPDVNAFALPDRRLVIHSGLVAFCRTPGELAGVVAHEAAHIEKRHVTRKLVKEVGLSMLMTIAGGQSGGEILRETARTLSSAAFDRDAEEEADSAAVRYLAAAGVDPAELANFLYRLSQEKTDVPKSLEWLSTHPNTADRAAEIIRLGDRAAFSERPFADSLGWESYRRVVRTAAAE